MASDPNRKLGEISFAGKDIPQQPAKYDRIAINSRHEVMLVSLVVESQFAKAIAAILNGGAKAQIQASGGRVKQPDALYGYPQNPGNVRPTSASYERHTQKLEFGQVHIMFVTRESGFMPVMSHDSLWRELTDVRFTTPVLREWLPYIEKALKDQNLLEQCESWNFPYADSEGNVEVMRCATLSATTAQLDEIVSAGLRNGDIQIPKKPAGSNLDLNEEDREDIEAAREATKEVGSVALEDLKEELGLNKPPRSWKIACDVGEGKPSYNGCRYKTENKARVAGQNLFSRWMLMKGFEIEESDDEPNQ